MFGEQMVIVKWRQVVQDGNGRSRASKEVLRLFGLSSHRRRRRKRGEAGGEGGGGKRGEGEGGEE
jgi:hypothetical protein